MTTLNPPPAHVSGAADGALRQENPILTIADGDFLRSGKPHRILAGSLHYFRVHPDLWADRLRKLVALGLNTVDTYVAWNFHQRHQGEPDFTGWRDIERFIDLAGEVGLDVIVRPGPYICAEWDNGGLPSWVTQGRAGRVRSSDPEYLRAVDGWFDALVPLLESRQVCHGGPVVAVQVENEYGSYGDDGEYMAWMRNALVTRGVTELLYTADGPTPLMLDGGTLEGTFAAATFGSKASEAAALLRSRRPGDPFLCAEFWNGWFDHWGETHNTRQADDAAANVQDVLDAGGSVSLYMAHGGTNFGLWSGANHDGRLYQPTVTSYDSDAPIAENGALTAKFHAIRGVLAGVGAEPGCAAEPIHSELLTAPTLPAGRIAIEPCGGLLPALRDASTPFTHPLPQSFEDLGLDAGLVLYTSRPVLPPGEVDITLVNLRDRAQVFIDGEPAGIIHRNDESQSISVRGSGTAVVLEILVENQGRINYGHQLGEGKGLSGVLVERRLVHHWENVAIPLAELDPTILLGRPSESSDAQGTGFARATLHLDATADTFIALPEFRKGFLWVNGFFLGRYWEVGPQETLYVPAPLLKEGANELIVLELEGFGSCLELRAAPELGPTKDYVETF